MLQNSVVTTFKDHEKVTYYFIHEIIMNNLRYEKTTRDGYVTLEVIGTSNIDRVTAMYYDAVTKAFAA